MDWREGFRYQAISDYAMYKRLIKDSKVERCHSLHFLVMATEKLAKYFLTPAGHRPKLTHRRFKDFVLQAKIRPELRRACKFGNYPASPEQFRKYCIDLVPAAERIESLTPQGTMDTVNPEYPWEQRVPDNTNRQGFSLEVIVPCFHSYKDFDPKRDTRIQNMMKFIESCFNYITSQSA